MHDPKIVAFEIRYPFKNKNGYRSSFITIWHNDPLNFRFPDGTRKQGGRRDDSCGWSTPMYHEQEWADLKKVAIHQYSELFARQVAEKEGKDYAYICNQPESTYEIVYWIWRAIKAHGKKGWQYGRRRNFLSAAELEFIMVLATAPGDNFKQHHKQHDEESFVDMFRMIWNQYRRFHRPWYKHPRWHVHHWSIQFHPWQQLKRRYWDKCCICGKRGFTGPAYGNWNDDLIWHGECANARKEAVTGINPIQQ